MAESTSYTEPERTAIDIQARIAQTDRGLTLLVWLTAINLAITLAILWRVFSH